MIDLLQVVSVMLVALTAASAMAHAMELPGKMRLDKDVYFAVQRIYYPGFTIAGIAEPASAVATAVLLFVTPESSAAVSLVLMAFLAMLAVNVIYWVRVHPVNKYWIEGQPMGALGTGFFAVQKRKEQRPPDWTELRNRWEYSHAVRAALSSVGLLTLVISLVVQQ